MKKKYKLKKSAIVILVLFILLIVALILFIISLFKTKSYSLEYNIDKYEINENYDNKDKYYYYEITTDKITYEFIHNSEYHKEKQLIKEVKEYNDGDYTCLKVESDYITTYPLCSYKNQLIDYHLTSETLQDKLSEYYKTPKVIDKKHDNYTIYNNNLDLFVWSYKGFNYISEDKIKFIKIFDKDIYEIPLATKINNYILIPDYEQEHNFNKVYILNLETLKVEKWKLKYDISFDSYILGTNDKSIFLIDKKNQKEYELVPHKQKMRLLASSNDKGTVYEEGSINKVSMNKLVSKEHQFTYKQNYKYILKNKTLYLSYLNSSNKIKVSEKKIDKIVYSNNDEVYYLIDYTLYRYSLKYGEEKLISYSEWEFNSNNLIFINS